mgnify:CR=1 FL=1|tara:strand:- start:8541 stop:9176 length:636 start_codon:yes stop_codon:yes gene_type:complete
MDSFKIKKMTINKITITSVFILASIAMNAQELIQASKLDDLLTAPKITIAGGGTIMDWANINFYKESNEKLKIISDPNRVVFMGNSITMDWSDYNPSFFSENPFVNRGIGGQTSPQMMVRFRTDVVNLNPKAVVIFAGTNDIAGNTGLISIENTAENIISMAEIAMAQYLNGLTDDTGTSLGYQATADKLLMPIPQPQMDINPNLVQNPGY